MNQILKRTISFAACAILTTAIFPPAAMADENGRDTTAVSLQNVYDLAYENNISGKVADLNLKVLYKSIEDISDAVDATWDLFTDPSSSLYFTSSMNSLMSQQISRETKESTELSVESAKIQIGLGGQSLLLNCYALQNRYEELNASAEKLERSLAVTRKMQEIGMATTDSVNALQQSETELSSSIQALSNAIDTIKAKLGTYIGVPETQMVIAPFDGITAEEAESVIAAIDYDADLTLAHKNCYALKIQRLTVKNNSGNQKKVEQLTLEAMEDDFPQAFKSAYLALKERASALSDAENAYALSSRDAETAALKFDRGMISKNSYLDSASQQAFHKNALVSAQLDFYSSLYAYEAMTSGIWQQ